MVGVIHKASCTISVCSDLPFSFVSKNTCLIETIDFQPEMALLFKFIGKISKKEEENHCTYVFDSIELCTAGAIDFGSPCVQRKNVLSWSHDNMQYKEVKKNFYHTQYTHIPWHWIHWHNIWVRFISCTAAQLFTIHWCAFYRQYSGLLTARIHYYVLGCSLLLPMLNFV